MIYSELNEETKKYLNKAMDIYTTIKDKNINKTIKDLHGEKEYKFTKFDKKVLALFIAGLLVDGKLKDIMSQYDDIKKDDIFEFINIKESDITAVEGEKYEDFFQNNIAIDLALIVDKKYYKTPQESNRITPEVIIKNLRFVGLKGTDILYYYGKKYNLSNYIFDHPLFNALDTYVLMNESDSDEEKQKDHNFIKKDDLFFTSPLIKPEIQRVVKRPIYEREFHEVPKKPKKPKKELILDDSIWLLLDDIQDKFIGQEQATEELFYNIITNQKLAEKNNVIDGARAIIFMDGPTGTGKTAITKEITKKLDIPFVSTSITNYSATGYKGGDIPDLVKVLYKKSDGDLEKAQRGIIVIDEIDKIAYSRSGELKMKKAVQQQLLDFFGGGKYIIRVGSSVFDTTEIEFDTSKLTFVCLGALTDLRSKKTENKQPFGFSIPIEQKKEIEYNITPQDLMKIGFENELVGRFNTYLHTDEYSKEALEKILRKSTISPLIGLKEWVESMGKKLIVDDDVYGLIADQAYEFNTGARSLQTVVNNTRTTLLKEVLRGKNATIHLNAESVSNINKRTMNRKGRG